jgi:predicted nuclease of predicted toxin-antitoxin system
MALLLIDEDLPRPLADVLRAAGHDALDMRDIGLRGQPDRIVFERAQAERRALVTGDLGFANILAFPAGTHFGIVVARLPNELAVADVNRIMAMALREISETELAGSLMIVDERRIHIRR